MSIYQRDGSYYVDVKVGGYKRVRKPAHTHDPKVATKYEKQLREDIKSGDYVFDVVDDGQRVPETLSQGFNRCLSTTWADSRNLGSVHANIALAQKFFGKDYKLRLMTTVRVNQYFEWLQQQGNAGATVNRKLATLQTMLNIAHTRWGALEHPVAFDRLKESKGRIRTISFETEELLAPLAQQIDPLFADLLVFLVETGCRLSEALNLSRRDIFKAHVQFWNTKHEYRAVPLSDYAKSVLSKHSDSLIPFSGLGTVFTVENKWRKLRAQMGEDSSFIIHALRHTFATRMVEAGVDIYTISQYLGHSNVSTTMRYAKITPVHLRSSMDRFESLRGSKIVPLACVINK